MNSDLQKKAIAIIMSLKEFKIVRKSIEDLIPHLEMLTFDDCQNVIEPSDKDFIGIVI